MKATRFYYRLADDANNDKALWTGAVSVKADATKADAREAIRETLCVTRLPANTLVLSSRELEHGDWTEAEIRAETVHQPRAPRKVKAFEDVPESFDDVQALLKKFGLA